MDDSEAAFTQEEISDICRDMTRHTTELGEP